MRHLTGRIPLFALLLALLLGGPSVFAQETGRIEGRVTQAAGQGVGGVTVEVAGTQIWTLTDDQGRFTLRAVPPGTQTLTFTLGNRKVEQAGVVVEAAKTARADQAVDWDIRFAETVTVFSASRRTERIVEAPAAVTSVSEAQIEREASHGQVPKLLEFTPGAEVTQSGVYDYNFNTRGFNSSLNRRVATLIDGRNPSVPFLGAQEWAAVSFPLDDLASVEFVRGPSAALYGANASSGVLNMTTKAPRFSEGGQLRLAGGELSTINADVRHAGGFGNDWYWKVTAGLRDGGDFTRSRFFMQPNPVEYSVPCPFPTPPGSSDCLPLEAAPLALENDNQIVFGSVRFDKYFAGDTLLTFEGGTAEIEGPAFQTGIGRVQLVEVERPWARINLNTRHWNVLAYYTSRDAPKQRALASGANVALDTSNTVLEIQTNWSFAEDRVRVVAGAAYGEEEIDTRDPATGLQTLVLRPIDSDKQAVFGQLDFRVSDLVKLLFAARVDDSSLHDTQFSPKGSVVFTLNPNHTLRLTYNEAFQLANYSEFFLRAPAAAPVNLQQVEVGICNSSGVACGLGVTPVFAFGNPQLDLEETTTIELGYTGIIGGKTFLTVDYYQSENKNFITDLLPAGQTALGRINPTLTPWIGPPDAENTAVNPLLGFPPGTTVAQAVRFSVPDLSTDMLLGNTIAVTYTNFGDVDTQGVDIGVNQYVDDNWSWFVNASWFDFDVVQQLAGFAGLLLPNTPEYKAGAGVAWKNAKTDVALSGRWVDEFRWSVGPFNGIVESYVTADLVVNHRLNESWGVGANVANVLDEEHWEAFGGDLLGRRALGYLVFSWR